MDYDHIVVGSGLAALGVALGLPENSRVLVIAGAGHGTFTYYDARRSTPCAYSGFGGLGNFWHGVIPMWNDPTLGVDKQTHLELLRYFYPPDLADSVMGDGWLFIPWRPIRPANAWRRLRHRRLKIVRGEVVRVGMTDQSVTARVADVTWSGRTLWMAAGALHTAQLLARSFGGALARGLASDHMIAYLGIAESESPPQIARTRQGLHVKSHLRANSLYMQRPARFDFKQLDHSIELRSVFGLPAAGIVRKLFARMSPGLFAEALFNRTGLGARAKHYSVYAQVNTPDAHFLKCINEINLNPNNAAIQEALRYSRTLAPFQHLRASRRSDWALPGIHLHHTLDLNALAVVGIDTPGAPIKVADASVVKDIGPAHHSFRIMARAFWRAKQIASD